MNKAVLLDRDGTINKEIPGKRYIHSVDDFEFLPGAVEAMRSLYDDGFQLCVVTNQSGIALGYYKIWDMYNVHRHMLWELAMEDVYVSEILSCPHHPSVSRCDCRKPGTGLLERAIKDLYIDVSKSYMVGDQGSDVEAGKRVGLTTIILSSRSKFADYKCKDLLEASKLILGKKP